MDEPLPPDEADRLLDQLRDRARAAYRFLHSQHLKAAKEPCDCDRASCGRCLELNRLEGEMRDLLRGW
jgi:hypothetical protein